MLAELCEYARTHPKPKYAPSVEVIIEYLQALNKLFERSILGRKVRVFASGGTTMCRMAEGFNFFAKWAKESEDKKSFLAWQVIYRNIIIVIRTSTHIHAHAHVDLGFDAHHVV